MYNADIVIHINESLGEDAIASLERDLAVEDGVVSSCVNPEAPHLMLVTYDPDRVQAQALLASLKGKGLHAQLVGM